MFIAVPVQEKTRLEIRDGIFSNERVRKLPVRWTAVQNLHLTLQFLGDVDEKRIGDLKQILNRPSSSGLQEKLVFTHVNAFPNPSAPKIIWLGIEKNDFLLKLQRLLSLDLVHNGFDVDRKPFKAHLTLGRVRENAFVPADAVQSLDEIRGGLSISDSPLDRVTLFESQLRPGGPLYSVLFERKLFSN